MIIVRYCQSKARSKKQKNRGFTLFELLVVLVIIGTLAMIAGPSWATFQANRNVTIARDEIHQGIRQAQTAAIARRSFWRFSLRIKDEQIEWATHADDQNWRYVNVWQSLGPNVTLDDADTTLAKREGVYYVRFTDRGEVKYRLSTVTVASKNGRAQHRCVVISTLIGATRKGHGQLYPNGNKRYCY